MTNLADDPKTKDKLGTCCFQANMLDISIFDAMMSENQRIIENTDYLKKFGMIDSLWIDVFTYLFKEHPKENDCITHNSEYQLIRNHHSAIHKALSRTDSYISLKEQCTLNYFNSMLATDMMISAFRLSLEEHGKSSEAFRIILSLNTKENYHQSIVEHLKNENMFSKISESAYENFLSTTNVIKSWGLNDHRLNPASYEEKYDVANKLRSLKKVKNIAEMAGRFKTSASSLRSKNTLEDGMELYSVHVTDQIHRALPSEKLMLANDSTKKSFYKKYHQKELLTYKYRNNKLKSKGPIICCIDTSGSMEGDLEIWSKSVAITLMDIAIKERRDFVAVMFSNKVYKTIYFNKNRIEPSKLYELATFFYGSGTNFVEPLTESIRLIETARYKYSDIVFITDGKAPMDEEFIEEFLKVKEKKQFRMITVNVSNEPESALDKINDIQLLLRDVNGEDVDDINEVLFKL